MFAWLLGIAGLATATANTRDLEVLFGTWGNDQQCAGEMIKEGGTLRAKPFILGPEWLKHGAAWCRLDWFPAQTQPSRIFVAARALCGEDAARPYGLAFLYEVQDGIEQMTLFWDEVLVNGPLPRCASS